VLPESPAHPRPPPFPQAPASTQRFYRSPPSTSAGSVGQPFFRFAAFLSAWGPRRPRHTLQVLLSLPGLRHALCTGSHSQRAPRLAQGLHGVRAAGDGPHHRGAGRHQVHLPPHDGREDGPAGGALPCALLVPGAGGGSMSPQPRQPEQSPRYRSHCQPNALRLCPCV